MADTGENDAELQLRRRKEARFQYSTDNAEDQETTPSSSSQSAGTPKRRSVHQFFREEWDTLAWIVAALVVTYITDFWYVLFQGEAVLRFWLHVGVGLFAAATVVMVTLFYVHPSLHHTNWLKEAPVGVASATALVVLGSISVTASLWPVWGIFAPSILFLLFMALVSIISLLP